MFYCRYKLWKLILKLWLIYMHMYYQQLSCSLLRPVILDIHVCRKWDSLKENLFIQYMILISSQILRVVNCNVVGPTALTVKKVRSVEGLSVDWVSKNLYFTDFFQGTLSVLRLKSPNETLVLMSGTGKPRSVVVHPLKGWLILILPWYVYMYLYQLV